MAKRVAKDVQPAVEERVEGIQAGHQAKAVGGDGLRRPFREAASGEPVQLGVKDHEHEEAEDIGRNRPTDDGRGRANRSISLFWCIAEMIPSCMPTQMIGITLQSASSNVAGK